MTSMNHLQDGQHLMTIVATDLKQDLETRFGSAVVQAFEHHVGISSRQLGDDEQKRHKGRMSTCTATIMGEGWIGTMTLMVPEEGAQDIGFEILGRGVKTKLRGVDVADGLGSLVAFCAILFGDSFLGEDTITVGPPTVVSGNSCALSFPWGNHFEARLAFECPLTPFWAILRLSHLKP